MAAVTYEKGKWRAEVEFEELPSGKYQGIVLLLHDGPPAHEQVVHRATNVSDTVDGALEEAKILAHHILGDLD